MEKIIDLLKENRYKKAEFELASLVISLAQKFEDDKITKENVYNTLKPLYRKFEKIYIEKNVFSDCTWDIFIELDVFETKNQVMNIDAMKKEATKLLRDSNF